MYVVVKRQIIIEPKPYPNVVIVIVWICIPYIVVITEVVRRPCIEVPISIMVPWSPCIVSVVSGDHSDFGCIRVCLNLYVFHIKALPALRHYMEFHHSIIHIIIC